MTFSDDIKANHFERIVKTVGGKNIWVTETTLRDCIFWHDFGGKPYYLVSFDPVYLTTITARMPDYLNGQPYTRINKTGNAEQDRINVEKEVDKFTRIALGIQNKHEERSKQLETLISGIK
jgi:hypothetical protein